MLLNEELAGLLELLEEILCDLRDLVARYGLGADELKDWLVEVIEDFHRLRFTGCNYVAYNGSLP